MYKDLVLTKFNQEMKLASGCTEVGCIAYAAAVAAKELNGLPERILLSVSPNIYKNGLCVFVPGTHMRGFEIAAALGCVLQNPEKSLSLMEHATPDQIDAALRLVKKGNIAVTCLDTPELISLQIDLFQNDHHVTVSLHESHTNITEIIVDDKIKYKKSSSQKNKLPQTQLHSVPLEELINFLVSQDTSEFSFLLEAAQINYKAAEESFKSPETSLTHSLRHLLTDLPQPFNVIRQAQIWTTAASEARMIGLPAPVMSITGSGNHGITNFLGMYIVAETLGVSEEKAIQSLMISTALTIYIKEYTGRVTAYCGSAIAPTSGVAAGTVYLLGGNYNQMMQAVQSVLGTFSGILCDGAKESCAYKINAAIASAIEFAFLAMDDVGVPLRNGIIGNSIQETLENLAKLNNPGMVETDRVVISLIQKNKIPLEKLTF